MAQNGGEGVLDKVKRTFQRMTSFEPEGPRLDPIVTMNNPPMMARRDATYDRAVTLIRNNLFSMSEGDRGKTYSAILELLEVSIANTRIILSHNRKGQKSQEQEPMLDYLTLLRDSVMAANTLVSHEIMLTEDEREMSAFLGSTIIEQFRAADDIFADSEMNIYHCVIELIDTAQPAISRYRDHRKRSFQKIDLDRYNKAFAEFETVYSKLGRAGQ